MTTTSWRLTAALLLLIPELVLSFVLIFHVYYFLLQITKCSNWFVGVFWQILKQRIKFNLIHPFQEKKVNVSFWFFFTLSWIWITILNRKRPWKSKYRSAFEALSSKIQFGTLSGCETNDQARHAQLLFQQASVVFNKKIINIFIIEFVKFAKGLHSTVVAFCLLNQ